MRYFVVLLFMSLGLKMLATDTQSNIMTPKGSPVSLYHG